MVPSPPETTFFIDRCLGAKIFPGILRRAGILIVPYSELYPGDQQVEDAQWLRDACAAGHACLTHDRNIRRDDATLRAFFDTERGPSGALFLLRGVLSARKLAHMFLEVWPRAVRMTERYRKEGRPFVAIIRRKTVKGGREIVEVARWNDRDEWEAMMARKVRKDR